MRLLSELSEDCLRVPATECTRAYMGKGAQEDALVNSTNRVDRLKWILKYTMGARHAFEMRRQELAEIDAELDSVKPDVDSIGDELVVKSFMDEVRPPFGAIFRYLQVAKLAWR